jgi:hypothetical protein
MTRDSTDSDERLTTVPTASVDRQDLAVDVPDGAPVHECPVCGRPFETERYLALHRGLAHPDSTTAADREAFAEAREEEAAAIRRFRLKALGAIILVYFVLLMVYALV